MMVRFNALLLAFFAAISVVVAQPVDHLASWNDGAAKKAITDFVARVTTPGGADFVPPEERIIGRRPILAFGNSDGDLQMLDHGGAGRALCGHRASH
ncbi:hypothetical protein CQ10_03230 [Bradyrhizobium valentinum]|uniref:Uncharacterized protein n=1 Tax=Bradyrhizobium valentinum TaxID=1518501 RepID=A0A0R3L5J5_9BRAD|nr:hypothetical protein CQ10_03230 [Bradyrhizobium valentinum]KRR04164.1 hypothetical protein CP49_22725 [Bradyrhizobium valentinum]